MKVLRWMGVACGLAVLTGCQTKTVEEMSYTERKVLADQVVQRCQAQKVPQAEMSACVNVEANREIATRRRSAQRQDAIAASEAGKNTNCQNFGGNIVCF